MSHFDCKRLPAWPTLNSQEHYWAGYCARYAEDHELVKQWYYGTSVFLERTDLDRETTTVAYLVESILCALTHQEVKLAFRCYMQARGYFERVSDGVRSSLRPALECAQARIESELFPGFTRRMFSAVQAMSQVS